MIERIKEAIEVLKKGGIILYPTDTVWGLGCDATNEEAVEKIFKLKQRADSKSLVTLAQDLDMIGRYVYEIPEMAIQLVEISDKPLTIIYPNVGGLASNVVAEDKSAAIRVPNHQFCIELLKRYRKPIVSTSANISGEATPNSFDSISSEIKDGVQWIADNEFDKGATNKASSILKIGLGGEIQIIRE